jgi:arylsulfatase A-like enzyme
MAFRHLLPILAVLLSAAPPAMTGERPNLLLIVSDDQQPDAIGAFGEVPVVTPALDSLVDRGVTFRRAYCMGSYSAAVCAPSRAMLLTGDTVHELPAGPYNLASPERSWWPERLRELGYQTFGTGKWHNGKAAFQRCFSDGGAIFFGGMGSHTDLLVHDYDSTGAYPNEARKGLNSFSSTDFTDAALAFLDRRDEEKPFFLYLSFTAPHDPRTPPEEDRALYDPAHLPLPPNYLPQHPFNNGELVIRDERLARWPRTPETIREHLADYYGMITHMDRQVGRVLDRLEAEGLMDTTHIAFVSDHGLAIGRHGLLGKQNLYEHSIGAPLIFAGPGIPSGVSTEAMCYVGDVFPTLLDLAGVSPGRESFFRSVRPCFKGAPGRESIVTCYRTVQRAICDGRWKLIRYPNIHKTQLFDLEADPHERNNLAGSDAVVEIEARLMACLAEQGAALGDHLPLTAATRQAEDFDFTPYQRE